MHLVQHLYDKNGASPPANEHHIVALALVRPRRVYDHTIHLCADERLQWHFWNSSAVRGDVDVETMYVLEVLQVQALGDDAPVDFLGKTKQTAFFARLDPNYSAVLAGDQPPIDWLPQDTPWRVRPLLLIVPLPFAGLISIGVWKHVILPDAHRLHPFGWRSFQRMWPNGAMEFLSGKYCDPQPPGAFCLSRCRDLADDLRLAMSCIDVAADPDTPILQDKLAHWIASLETGGNKLNPILFDRAGTVGRYKNMIQSLLLAEELRRDGRLRVAQARSLSLVLPAGQARDLIQQLDGAKIFDTSEIFVKAPLCGLRPHDVLAPEEHKCRAMCSLSDDRQLDPVQARLRAVLGQDLGAGIVAEVHRAAPGDSRTSLL